MESLSGGTLQGLLRSKPRGLVAVQGRGKSPQGVRPTSQSRQDKHKVEKMSKDSSRDQPGQRHKRSYMLPGLQGPRGQPRERLAGQRTLASSISETTGCLLS